MRILLLTDRSVAQALRQTLERDGCLIETLKHPERFDGKTHASNHEVILLDQAVLKQDLPRRLLRWRQDGMGAHLLVFLAQQANTADRVAILDAGADGYLLHPVNVEEVRAYLRALQRRDRAGVEPIQRIRDLEIHTAGRRVNRAGRSIRLTSREFDLLRILAAHRGRVVSRSMIRESLYEPNGSCSSNVIDVYIRYLRNKIDHGFDQPLILTRWGEGYLLRGEDA